MAITSAIPLPSSGIDALFQGAAGTNQLLNSMIQRRAQQEQSDRLRQMMPLEQQYREAQISHLGKQDELFPLQQQLLAAKTQQALAKAKQAEFFQNLFSGGFGSGELTTGFPTSDESGEEVISMGEERLLPFDRFAGMTIPGAGKIPEAKTHYDTDGNLITRYPSGKITKSKVGESKADIERASALAKNDAKVVSTLEDDAISTGNLMQTYDRLEQKLKDPEWDKINSSLISRFGQKGRQYNLDWVKTNGTPEQKKLIAAIENESGEIVAKMARAFKGPFRVTEQSLVERMKPNATDTPEAARAKLEEMKQALSYQYYISTRVPELIRKEKLSPTEAFKKAKEEVGVEQFTDELKSKYSSKMLGKSDFDFSKYPVAGG